MTSLTPSAQRAWTAIRISAQWATVRRCVESCQRLKVAEARLLWLLRDERPRTLREIAEDLDLEQSTVNRQVHAALESGVLERTRPQGAPAYVVSTSDEGRERFDADMARLTDVYERALRAVPADEQEHFLEQLTAFVDALGEAARHRPDTEPATLAP